MKIIHQQWQLVGQILVVDDEGEAQVIGKDSNGVDVKVGTLALPIARFRGNEVAAAYEKAREACAELLAKYQEPAPVLELVPSVEEVLNEVLNDQHHVKLVHATSFACRDFMEGNCTPALNRSHYITIAQLADLPLPALGAAE
jgi:hypothetical protein